MRLAMSNIAWLPAERLAAYECLAAAGLTGLEIAPGLFFHAAEDPFRPDSQSARTALAEIAAAGLTLVSMQSLLFGVAGASLFGPPKARAAFKAGMIRAIELAERFAIPNLVFGAPTQRRVPEGLAPDAALGEAAALFADLGARAAAAGTRLAIEANPAAYGTNFLTSLAEAEAFVALVDHPAVTLNLDLGELHMNGSFAALPGRLPRLAARLGHVHVSEPELAPAPADAAALAEVLRGLGAAGYGAAVSIEMRRPQGGLAEVGRMAERLAAAARAAAVPIPTPLAPEHRDA
ncbi:sugar phosphate isomerase/epimerase family protein [Erythrobacter cryptus]|uniref:sugar phosphate isomerase/epimerase family protein n=1 Tax=Erythrobacter cryptus TaxID=196588 RepID=UPI00040CA311|nr:TIM barrel protein [Erythrobacter cryptus]